MVSGKHKTRTVRRVYRKTPSGKVKVHYKQKLTGKATCGSCGKILPGTLTAPKSVMKNTAKTKKRPERPYGGVLCSECMRRTIIKKARDEDK